MTERFIVSIVGTLAMIWIIIFLWDLADDRRADIRHGERQTQEMQNGVEKLPAMSIDSETSMDLYTVKQGEMQCLIVIYPSPTAGMKPAHLGIDCAR